MQRPPKIGNIEYASSPSPVLWTFNYFLYLIVLNETPQYIVHLRWLSCQRSEIILMWVSLTTFMYLYICARINTFESWILWTCKWVEVVLLHMCVMQRLCAGVFLHLQELHLWLKWTSEILSIWTVPWFWADLLPKFVLYHISRYVSPLYVLLALQLQQGIGMLPLSKL